MHEILESVCLHICTSDRLLILANELAESGKDLKPKVLA